VIGGASRYDQMIVMVWIFGCVLGGGVFIIAGARAAGLALLGSLVGAFAGFTLVSSNYDLLAVGAVIGATVGTVAFGLGGLFWRSRATRSRLAKLAVAVVVFGALAVLGLHVGSNLTCSFAHGSRPCLRAWDPATRTLVAFNIAIVALICLLQSRQAATKQSSGGPASAR
jgi:hypothetical protein